MGFWSVRAGSPPLIQRRTFPLRRRAREPLVDRVATMDLDPVSATVCAGDPSSALTAMRTAGHERERYLSPRSRRALEGVAQDQRRPPILTARSLPAFSSS